MTDMIDVSKDPERPGEDWVQVTWVGLADELIWEPVSIIYEDAPKT